VTERAGCCTSLRIARGVVPGRNVNGVYLYLEDVDGLAARLADWRPGGGPSHKTWGVHEESVSDPDGTLTLVRIGWPSEWVR
jgi:hypothetical protein